LPFIFSIIALYFVLFIFSNTKYFIKKHRNISFRILINNKKVYKFLINKWCFDIIYNDIFIKFILKQAHYRIFTLIDRGLLEFLGPFGITNFIKYLSIFVRKLQTGYAYEYAYVMFWLLIINFIMIDFFFHK
jgi:NADH:ubiquinone oxidoreductase subunit 5 (subunit L)/multisubunit Na+/H+ antiporter MnhA subunit